MPYIGKSPVTGNYNSLDDMSGSFNSSTTTFNLLVNSGTALTPVRAEALIISINGVIQEPGTDFTVSAATMTYTTAPASTDSFFGVVLGQQLDIATPGDGTVGTAKIADGAVTMAKLGETVTIAKGGTGATAAAAAFTALASTQATVGNGSVSAPAITSSTATADSGIYFPAADTVGVVSGGTEQFRFGSNPIPGGNKNIIQNGAMTINQRGISALALDGANQTTVDRWRVQEATSAGAIQVNQSTTVPAGAGFASSLHVDVTTADTSIAAGDYVLIYQTIEAQNLQHLAYGNAAAKTLSLSFWVRSPKSGTHAVALFSADGSRHYIREYTVTSADTYEYITVTFPGDASGTINNDTGPGFDVYFPLVTGSTYQNTADTWAAGQDWSTSSAVNCMDDAANNFYLTGVQLEVGSVATDFAHEDVGTTLIKCMRYFQILLKGDQDASYHCIQNSTTSGEQAFTYPVEMRAVPTSSLSDLSHVGLQPGGVTKDPTTFAFESGYTGTRRMWSSILWSGGAGSAYNMFRVFSDSASCLWTMSAEL